MSKLVTINEETLKTPAGSKVLAILKKYATDYCEDYNKDLDYLLKSVGYIFTEMKNKPERRTPSAFADAFFMKTDLILREELAEDFLALFNEIYH